jgi:hypothetical protein
MKRPRDIRKLARGHLLGLNIAADIDSSLAIWRQGFPANKTFTLQARETTNMQATRCPKCIYYEQTHRAPLGKIVRNPYAREGSPVYDDCNACNGSGYIPMVVVDSIVKFARGDVKRAEQILVELKWHSDHFAFMAGNMYVGIEKEDGYLHT